jgi:hypothetical protein
MLLKTNEEMGEAGLFYGRGGTFLHLPVSQNAIQKPSLKHQTASNADVEARYMIIWHCYYKAIIFNTSYFMGVFAFFSYTGGDLSRR